jgi:alkaline phosphatase D
MSEEVPKTMKALVYDSGAEKHGVKLADAVPVPVPGATQVLVRVHAAALNPVDYKLPTFPVMGWVLGGKAVGFDFAGKVVATGDKAAALAGKHVFGACQGAIAEYCIAEMEHVAEKPEAVTFSDAASLNVAGVTSLLALEETGMQAGDTVLVVGGSGGCGSFGVQLAKLLGAAKVVAVASDKNVDFCKSLGADVVCSYTAGTESLVAALKEHGPYDAVFDSVTSSDDMSYEQIARDVLKPGKVPVGINGPAPDMMRALASSALGFNLQRGDFKICMHRNDKDTPARLGKLAQWVADGKLKVVTDSKVPFTQEGIYSGYDNVHSRRAKGKVVVNVRE